MKKYVECIEWKNSAFNDNLLNPYNQLVLANQ